MPDLGTISATIGADVQPLVDGTNTAKKTLQDLGHEFDILYQAMQRSMPGGEMWTQYNSALKGVEDQMIQLEQEAQALNQTMGNTQNVVPQTTSNFNGLNMMLRETHTLGYSTSRGIVSLTFGFTALAKEIQAAKAAGQSMSSIWNTLGAQLFTMQSLIVVAGDVIAILAHHFLSGRDSAKELSEAEKELQKTQQELQSAVHSAASDYADNKDKLLVLTSVMTDGNVAMHTRIDAMKEAKKEYPELLSNYSQEDMLNANFAKTLQEKLIPQLHAAALMKAALGKADVYSGQEEENIMNRATAQRTLLEATKQLRDYEVSHPGASMTQSVGGGQAGAGTEIRDYKYDELSKAVRAAATDVVNFDTKAKEAGQHWQQYIEDAKNAALKGGKLTIDPGKDAKEKVDQVAKAIEKIKNDLSALDRQKGILGDTKYDEEKLRTVEAGIRRLYELKVSPNNSVLKNLLSIEPDLKSLVDKDKINDYLDKFNNEITSTTKDKKIKMPVDLQFAINNQTDGLEQRMQQFENDLNTAKELNIKLPIRFQMDAIQGNEDFKEIDDLLNKVRQKLKKDSLTAKEINEALLPHDELLQLNKMIQSSVAGAFEQLGDSIGNIISGKGNPFQNLLRFMGETAKQFGASLIKYGTEMLVALNALKAITTNPYLAIAAGIGLEIVGTIIQSSASNSVHPHADGGVFMGPTQIGNHLFGEAGPEFLVGQSKLQNMLDQQGFGQRPRMEVFGKIKGQDIEISSARTKRQNNNRY